MPAAPPDFRRAILEAPSNTIDFFVDAFSPQFVETICAFANTEGGDIFIGLAKGPQEKVDVGGIKLPIRNSEEVYLLGVDPGAVAKVTNALKDHFDDPLPTIVVEPLEEKGPDGVIVKVHVEPERTKESIALRDLTIWHREGTKNVQVGQREHPLREAKTATKDARKKGPPTKKTGKKPESEPEIVSDQLVTWDEILEFSLSPSLVRSCQFAQDLVLDQSVNEPVNASYLLFGMLEAGRRQPTSPNVVAFLAGHVFPMLEQRYDECRKEYHSNAYQRTSGYGGATANYATVQLRAVVEHAGQIARKFNPADVQPVIAGRHMVGALLTFDAWEPDGGAPKRIEELGLDLTDLRAGFLDLMLRHGDPGEREAWIDLLEGNLPAAPHQIARYNADRVSGEDKLNITPDVNAMANLIASMALQPPLSIGLFGNWGSGKTFFIEKLQERVQGLEECGKRRPEYRDSYWPNIVQITFNAWNYVDANLWASLVSHVFEELSRYDDSSEDAIKEAKAAALEKLTLATQARFAAEAKVEQASRAHEKAANKLEDRKSDIKQSQEQLAKAIAKDVWDDVRDTIVAGDGVLKDHLKEIGVATDDLGASAEQVYRHLQEMTTLTGRARAVWLKMLHGREVTSGLAVWVGIAAVVLFGSLVLAYFQPNMAWLTALAGEFAALLGGGSRWVRNASAKVSEVMAPVRALQAQIEGTLKKAEQKKAEQVASLEDVLKQRHTEYEAALRELDEAEQAVEAAQAELTDVQTGGLIRRFIEQRAASEDYRQHLGIVATIREDFQKLSDLIAGYNDARLERETDGVSSTSGKTPPENLGINRIVLYIDDLDRCPPERVVEVLQAIHLLLAFRLFVVVVAVDSRWISYALQKQYPHLLVDPFAASENNGESSPATRRNRAMSASPRDYLEKIFQVPFWIRPMDGTGCRNLIDALVRFDQSGQKSGQKVIAGQTPKEISADVNSGEDGQAGEQSLDRGQLNTAAGESFGQTAAAANPAESHQSEEPQADPSPESLRLEHVEIAAMKSLAVIIGRSPRETKRFVNVYRLMKAAIHYRDLKGFVGTDEEPGSFRHAMVLLAIVTGCPHLATVLFDRCVNSDMRPPRKTASRATSRPNLAQFVTSLKTELPPPLMDEWRRLNQFLSGKNEWSKLKIDELRTWMARTSQFSFESSLPPLA